MTRTQLVSLALSPLLFSFLVSRNIWGIFFTAFGIAWVHPNFLWLPLLLLIGVNAASDCLKDVGLWLERNSQPGDIVFNLHRSDFSPLFFWNQKNYSDPRFEKKLDTKREALYLIKQP